MYRRSAFTLIELLVVIAIIAILASILFPVFAQAREKARSISCLSNTKQMGTGIMMYVQDYDETYPCGFGATPGSWIGLDLWCQKVQPYLKNLNVFVCPDDSKGGPLTGADAWMGWGISYAVNGYYSSSWTNGFQLLGPMGIDNNGGWLAGAAKTDSAITQPAATILLTEKHNSDVTNWSNANYGGANPGNVSWFWVTGVIGGPQIDNAGGWAPSYEPDGTRSASTAWPYGQAGSVSTSHNGMANFAFCDGHSKAMRAVQTNPDPVNQPQNNMWDGTR